MQIMIRRRKLSGNPKQPLSIYRTHEGKSTNITTADVKVSIRTAAAKLYNLHPVTNKKKELQMWSSHSLRVGAYKTKNEQII
jgi:HD-like signal output (HDOD) protein